MRKLVIGLVALFCLAGISTAQAQVRIGVSGGNNGISNFYLSIGSYFKVPQAQVTVIKQRRIADEQIPVVLFIAQRGHVTPEVVMELRGEGFSWMEVALRCGVGPENFYVETSNSIGPYARPYGDYHKYNKKQWRKIRLNDNDIVNFVNLRFISENHRCKPDEVMAMRSKGQNFVNINENWMARTAPAVKARQGNKNRMDKNPGRQHNGNR
jgi:hypothetical protein